ncbi:MAG: ABC transporter permease [Clostridia bacterium]|nr:ABC transporter permease [Clostridia bacterium]
MSNNTGKKAHEPLFHIIKRNGLPFWKSWLIRILSVIAALIVCGIVIVFVTGENPLEMYKTMFEGAFGTERRRWGLMQDLAMLLCVSLAVTPAFKMKFWNIGAEGQVLIGGLATAACMILFGEKLSPYILYPLMICSSIIAGAVWAVIPAFFKAKWNTNETLFTLMMNYIAIQILSYFSYIWSNPKGSGKIGIINASSSAGWLPYIGNNKYLFNILIVLALTIFMYIYLKYSKHGYELSVVGESENTARYIGINVKKVIIRTMLLSGAICGIAGLLLVAGANHTVSSNAADGRGFTAIMVSWLAKFNPIYMILTSLLLVFLDKGATEISTTFSLNDSFSEIITGIIIFFIIGSEFFINYKIKFREKEVITKPETQETVKEGNEQ